MSSAPEFCSYAVLTARPFHFRWHGAIGCATESGKVALFQGRALVSPDTMHTEILAALPTR
jgi:hypothetical protein